MGTADVETRLGVSSAKLAVTVQSKHNYSRIVRIPDQVATAAVTELMWYPGSVYQECVMSHSSPRRGGLTDHWLPTEVDIVEVAE